MWKRPGVEMFYGRQPRARGRVLACSTETGTVHDSRNFLTSHPDTLWCPFAVCFQCYVTEFCDRFRGSCKHSQFQHLTECAPQALTRTLPREDRTHPERDSSKQQGSHWWRCREEERQYRLKQCRTPEPIGVRRQKEDHNEERTATSRRRAIEHH